MSVHIIDPSGEVTLIVKNTNAPFAPVPENTDTANPQAPTNEGQANCEESTTPEVRIKVSTKHLILASPVFKRGLTGSWLEGFDFKRNGTVEIQAQGWDTQALLILMKIFHCQPHEIPAQAAVELIAKLGVLADYYECIPLVRYYAMKWITPDVIAMTRSTKDDTYTRDVMVRLWISWVFDRPYDFKAYCERLVQNSRGPICPFGLPIPVNIIDALNKRRETAFETAISLINSEHQAILADESRCTVACRSMTLGTLLIFLDKHKTSSLVAPYSGVVLSELVLSVRSIKRPTWREYKHNESPPWKWHGCSLSSFSNMFRSLGSSVEGLNLDDFKPGVPSI